MKICILTQKLGGNYGGVLQAYALQAYLKKEGYTAETVQHCGNQKINFSQIKSIIKQVIKKFILFQKVSSVVPDWMNKKQQDSIYRHLRNFIEQNIVQTPYIKNFKNLNCRNYKAYIVGSDQVWRPRYNKYQVYEMFLSFVKGDTVKRISYAASFGVSDMEFSEEQIHKVSELLSNFDAVSVREDSGVDLCRNYFHVEAQHVLDPTMLLQKEDYLALIQKEEKQKAESIKEKAELFVYVLDQSPEVVQLIRQVADEFQIQPYQFLPKIEKTTIMPSVTAWLNGFSEAKFVVTDSFHGTVFAILFNKPFIVYANKQRGATRFHSLLKMFHLENRLVVDKEESVIKKLKDPIDWEKVNQILEKERTFSSAFLKNALNNV
jgi:hypothetical protein